MDTNVISLIFSQLNYTDAINFKLTCKRVYNTCTLPVSIKRWKYNNIYTMAYKKIIRHNYEGEYMPGFSYLIVRPCYRIGNGVIKETGYEYVIWCKEDIYIPFMKYALDVHFSEPEEVEEFERRALKIAYHVSKR